MENGYFQTRLSNIDFEDSPLQVNFLKKSSTIDNLINQTEDLTARLKVSIQKQALLENSLESAESEIAKIEKVNQALTDQLLIWKEKEKIWFEKLELKEQEISKIKNQIPHLKVLEAEVLRYKKYHDKVKRHVKPYIEELKNIGAHLTTQVKELRSENSNKEYNLAQLKKRIHQLEKQILLDQESYQKSVDELNKIQETQISQLELEILSLREDNSQLNIKTSKLDNSLARQDELENLNISLRRKLNEIQDKSKNQEEGLRTTVQLLKNDLTKKDFLISDLETEIKVLNERLSAEVKNTSDLKEQMLGLRNLWNDKSLENERLKISLQSLEKLNLELSKKLHEFK